MSIEIGKTYLVNHSRKGTFALAVTAQDDEWVTGNVIGTAKAIMDYNVKVTGEPITVRKSFCKFTEQPA